MAMPTTREEFKQFCLRKLGAPVIEINVDDEQIEDRIDEALSYYWDYHFDGSEMIYYKHQVTQDDIDNKYIYLPENIMGAVKVFNISDPMISSDDMFNIRYQIALNDLYTLTSTSLVPYYMMREHLALIQEILVPDILIRYSRHKNKLSLDMNWDVVKVGEYLIVEAYEVIDPEIYSDVWKDRWLQKYASAKIAENWGRNLTKFIGMTLPGGVQFNGEKILDDANRDIENLEKEMIFSYSLPVSDMVG